MGREAEARSGARRFFVPQREPMEGSFAESTAYRLWGYRGAAMCLALGNPHDLGGRGYAAPGVDPNAA